MRAALGTMALLLFGQAFGDDQKPYKITLPLRSADIR